MFRALRYRNYRLFFLGHGVSVIGTWMQQTALAWLMYRLTGSAFLLGVASFADKIPVTFLTPFAGVLIDRSNRYRIVLLTQALLMAQAVALAWLALSGAIQVWHILALSLLLGGVNALDIPARQSLAVELIEDKQDLGNAIALNSTIFNAARLIGPAAAGVLIGWTSEGVCFAVNALSYLAVLTALLGVRVPPRTIPKSEANAARIFKEGWDYVSGFLPARSILLLLALVSLMGVPFSVLLPVVVGEVFGGGPDLLGFMIGASGAGAVAGAMFLAGRKSVRGLGQWIVISSGMFALGLVAFSFSKILWLSLALMALCGFGMMVHMASSNTILQTIVDEERRGRVMSFYVLAISGMAPFGSLLTGSLASQIGAGRTLCIGGLYCLAGTFLFWRNLPEIRRHVRPIYEQMGILQSGIKNASEIEALEK